jgi:hypothetical protein
MRARIEFVPNDLWIGVYWRRRYHQTDIYICLIPCFPLHLIIDNFTFRDWMRRG